MLRNPDGIFSQLQKYFSRQDSYFSRAGIQSNFRGFSPVFYLFTCFACFLPVFYLFSPVLPVFEELGPNFGKIPTKFSGFRCGNLVCVFRILTCFTCFLRNFGVILGILGQPRGFLVVGFIQDFDLFSPVFSSFHLFFTCFQLTTPKGFHKGNEIFILRTPFFFFLDSFIFLFGTFDFSEDRSIFILHV